MSIQALMAFDVFPEEDILLIESRQAARLIIDS